MPSSHLAAGRFVSLFSILCFGLSLGLGFAGSGAAEDRASELEGLREKIQDSRERVTAHEADERAFLEQFEELDRSLRDLESKRRSARSEFAAARKTLAEIEPKQADAEAVLSRTQGALAARAVALYRGGEVGPLRVLFSAESLPEMVSRANALRILVRHDAELVERFAQQRNALLALRDQAAGAVEDRERATARLDSVASELRRDRDAKSTILSRVRRDRKTERSLLLELEQAATALEETIRSLGRDGRGRGGESAGAGLGRRRGALPLPVDARISERFGRVVDPEFQTSTFRSGVDFAAKAGAPVRSVAPGIVRFAGWFRGYGRIVIIDHGEDFHTVSGHLDAIHVEVDQVVKESVVIGTVGETGSLGGPSLYFEVRRGGDPVDPEDWLIDPRG